jgi:hypothetical protein
MRCAFEEVCNRFKNVVSFPRRETFLVVNTGTGVTGIMDAVVEIGLPFVRRLPSWVELLNAVAM